MKKFIGIIPCHLNSIRLKKKILIDINGLPMVEHVRRRALQSNYLDNVFIASGDDQILEVMKSFKADTIKTKLNHKNGTSRIIEAIKKINAKYILLIQGDEPLLKPSYIDTIIEKIKNDSNSDVWNLTAPLKKKEINETSIVKCEIKRDFVIDLFRKSKSSKKNFRKILGLIAFKRDILMKLNQYSPSIKEKKLSIEQIRIIENNFKLKSVKVRQTLQSVNVPGDVEKVKKVLKENRYQSKMQRKIFHLEIK